jgi:hypothetical protein
LIRRLVRYGKGLNPFGPLSDDDLRSLEAAMSEAGRDLAALEKVGGIRATFHRSDDVADLDVALADLPRQVDQGFTTICFKPAMFCRTVKDVPALCRRLVEAGRSLG